MLMGVWWLEEGMLLGVRCRCLSSSTFLLRQLAGGDLCILPRSALLCSISLLVLNPNLNGDYIHSPGAIWRFWAPNGIFLRKKTRGRSFRWRSISCDSSCSCYVLFWIEALWCVSDSKVAIYLFNFFLIYGLVWIHLIRLGFFVGIWNWIRLLELVKISDFLDFERNLGAFPPSFQMKRSSSNLYSFWNCNFYSFEKMI